MGGDLCAKFETDFKYSKFTDRRGEAVSPSPIKLEGAAQVFYSLKKNEVVRARVSGAAEAKLSGIMGDVGSDKSLTLLLEKK